MNCSVNVHSETGKVLPLFIMQKQEFICSNHATLRYSGISGIAALQASQQEVSWFRSLGARGFSVCMFFPCPHGFSSGSLASSRFKDMHLGASWWPRTDLWWEHECGWLSVSIFLPCDELTTCPGHSAPLAPRQMGEAPAPRKTPLRDKAVDDGWMGAPLPRLIPQSGTTWNPLIDISITSSLLASVSK